ncbi:MAG: toprim domain-containing protein [Rubrivivax sp.]|nr:toprim domain-containing protein [Rubrivivax sp.]
MNPADAFTLAIEAASFTPPADIRADGTLHRFAPTGRRGDDAGWYVLHLDGVPAGAFGCWRTGYVENWCAKRESELTPAERRQFAKRVAEMRRQREAEQARRQADAATAALARLDAAPPAGDHPYLQRKAVRAYGIRVEGAALLVPMRTSDGKLHSLQTITPDGTKRFMHGGRVRGCYFAIGRPNGALIVCEGFATGATIHEATGQAVAVAFNAGNLEPVARALRAKFPCASILIAGDDDHRTAGNPGRTAAEQAALSVGGIAVLPLFPVPRAAEATDFNDLAAACGLQAVRAAFTEILEVA